jgi:hypothetical protein
MFGLSKIYERKFEPHDAGYSYQALTGNKYVSPEERDELVSSYRKTLKFDFLGLFKAMLALLMIILVAAFAVVLFDLPKSILDAAAYVAMIPILIVAIRPTWNHLKKSYRILTVATPLPRKGSWLERLRNSWFQISWMRIGISLPIFGFIFYRLISSVALSTGNWIVVSMTVVLGLGLLNLMFAAVWKILNRQS